MTKKNKTEKLITAISHFISPDINFHGEQSKFVTWNAMKKKKIKNKDNEYVGILDPANVAEIVPMNEQSYNLLFVLFRNDESQWSIAPNLDFTAEKGEECTSKYSPEYLEVFMEIARALNSSVRYFPLVMEVKDDVYHYELILAPRVDDD